jgi:ABC-type transport system involved in cytochrome bd biosynthesis fused ATPase/permease subunit
MNKALQLLKSLKAIAEAGVPLRHFLLPNFVQLALEMLSLSLLARLVQSVLTMAGGTPPSIWPLVGLTGVLVAKSFVNAWLLWVVYSGFRRNEVILRQLCLDLARSAPSRQLRSESIETVTHQINVYPPNLTYNVYGQLMRLMSDLLIAACMLLAMLWINFKLSALIVVLFAILTYAVGSITFRKSVHAGHVSETTTLTLVNQIARYLRGRNEVVGGGLDPIFRGEIEDTNRVTSTARATFNYLTLVPRIVFDGVLGVVILAVILAVSSGWAPMSQRDLSFIMAAALKLAPYLTSILAGLLQIGFAKSIVDGYSDVKRKLAESPDLVRPVTVDLSHENGVARLFIVAQGKEVSASNGDILLLKGRSGSGKTTIAEMIADVAEGRIGNDDSRARRHIAYCSQFPTVLNVSLCANVSAEKAEDTTALIERYGIAHFSQTEILNENTLSGGERQRIGIIRAINQTREIVVFDEPTASIGTAYANKIKEDIGRLAASGALVVILTHDVLFDDIATKTLELA